jgi:ketosteroid isomerase-like protein
MAHADVEMIERAYGLWAQRRFDDFFAMLDPEIEWIPPAYALEPGTVHGIEEVKRGVGAYFEAFAEFVPSAERIMPTGREGEYLSLATTRVRGRESGVETQIEVAHLIQIRDGRFVRFQVFPDRAEAFAATGLDPAT